MSKQIKGIVKTPDQLIAEAAADLMENFTPEQAQAIFATVFTVCANAEYLKDMFINYIGVSQNDNAETSTEDKSDD